MKQLSSVWPRLNKQDHIHAYLEQLESRDFDECKAEIAETVCLTSDEWDHFRTHLMQRHAWLDGKGGCPKRHVRSVVLVVRPGETPSDSLGILVDPQGYDYARYVGFYINGNVPRQVTNPPDLPDYAAAMETTLNGLTFCQRVLENINALERAEQFDGRAAMVGA